MSWVLVVWLIGTETGVPFWQGSEDAVGSGLVPEWSLPCRRSAEPTSLMSDHLQSVDDVQAKAQKKKDGARLVSAMKDSSGLALVERAFDTQQPVDPTASQGGSGHRF